MKKIICNPAKKKELKNNQSYINASLLREAIFNLIKKDFPDLNRNCFIDKKEVTKYRNIHLRSLIKKQAHEFENIDKNVIDAILNEKVIVDNIEDDLEEALTLGQKIADKVAEFGGSWAFLISFAVFIFIWIAINVWVLATHPFDPYPFILLNLFLSVLAAIQAPIIMMSQNRQEQKDRKRDENDYKINLKAELEIKLLHDKIDHIINYQNQKIMENLELDTDYLEEIKEILNNR